MARAPGNRAIGTADEGLGEHDGRVSGLTAKRELPCGRIDNVE